MKFCSGWGLVALLIAALGRPAIADDLPAWGDGIADRIVQIELMTGSLNNWTPTGQCGVGLLIAENVILTAAHVLQPPTSDVEITAYRLRRPRQKGSTTVAKSQADPKPIQHQARARSRPARDRR